ncbi:MAG: hypothetical protein AB8I08_22095 [Sandaracinaceae bacterium]
MRSRQLDPHSLSSKQALELLEALSEDPGLLGVGARFAKARVILTKGAA